MPLSSLFSKFKDSIPGAALLFPVSVGLLMLIMYVGLTAHGAATAYIRGESVWAKSQKEAVLALDRYVEDDDITGLTEYRERLGVPRADRRARELMELPEPDLAGAEAAFVAGANDPADAGSMVRYYRIFQREVDVRDAVTAWRTGDRMIDSINALVPSLIAARQRADTASVRVIRRRISVLDRRLSVLERAFSESLGKAARWLRSALLVVALLVSTVLMVVGTALTRRIVAQSHAAAEAERALRERDEQLRQGQKMEAIGRLAGGVAHDFNNILTAISAHAELLREELPADSPARADVDEIARAARRAASLTRQLLAFSRQQVLAPRLLDLNTVVTEMEKMLRRLIGENITLDVECADALHPVLADRGQLEQVLLNLAVNARDAMPGGGTLTLSTSNLRIHKSLAAEGTSVREPTPGDYVALTVADTGIGMDEPTRRRAFEPFFTTKEQGKGTGLGLATVHGIVEQSGGFIDVESAPGHGARFHVLMPRAETGQQESGAWIAPNEDANQQTGTILLAEDEEQVRAVARRILVSRGYTVLEAKNGREALAIARTPGVTIDIVVTDALMPEMSGPALIAAMRESGFTFAAVLMSGYTDDAVIRSGAFPVGAIFVQKPFTAQGLLHAIVDALAARRAAA